ncbi:MAG: hypothetical protein Q9191_008338, partial [Dirinaria sp. TL-2023a]
MATGKKDNEELKTSKLFDVSGFSCVVTAQALVSNGAKVYITGRRAEALDNVVQLYNTGPGNIVA